MRNVLRSASLIVISLAPAAAVGGCFGSSSSTAPGSSDASTDVVTGTGMGDGQVSDTQSADHAVDQQAPPPPAAGGTGAFGIITIGGKQKMYLPQQYGGATGNASIAVVDVGAPGSGVAGAPAQITNIDLGSSNYATATGGDSTVVIAVSTANGSIYFIDPRTDTLTKTIMLDPSFGISAFSGGGGYVTGVAIDSAHHRAFLSVWNGIAVVDLTTQTLTQVIEAPPTENFGFDSVHGWIIAPFYECTNASAPNADGGTSTPASCGTPMLPDGGGVITDGLSIIDLSDNTVYTYEASPNPPDGGANFTYDPTAPVGLRPDSAAADPSTGVIVIPSEGNYWQNIIDLSKATFNKATKTVTAPLTIVPNVDYDGVAVEPNKHIAFWEQEFSQTVAAARLDQSNLGGTAAVQASMPAIPSGNTFSNLGIRTA